jgi:cytidine deaminase
VNSLSDLQIAELRDAALGARERAYAPYSEFYVGAALLCADGAVMLGCNVENASYGLCVCAERTALCAAVAAGKTEFVAIAISTSSSPPSPPCGMCRQSLREFCDDLTIFLVNPSGETITTSLAALFPGGFDKDLLRKGVTGKRASGDRV